MSSIHSESLVASKENIQPLRRGRDTSQLCAGLQAETDTEKHQALEKQRNEFEILLRSQTKSSEDPLKLWIDYVNWIEQSFPKQPQKGNLSKVLNRCLSKFQKDERYINDARYVKLCIRYADIEEDTVGLLGTLHGNGIGVKCADLYIAWADKYALDGCFKKANAIYEKGLKNRAEPFEVLEAAHKNFLASVALRMLSKTESNEASGMDTQPEETRQPYNVLQKLAVGRTDIVPSVRVGQNVLGEPGKLKMNSKKESKPKNNTPITIYQDGENDAVSVEAKVKLDKIPTRKTLTKENSVKAGIWTDKQKKSTPFTLPPPPAPVPFQVHVDEDSVEFAQPRPVASSVLKQHKIKKGYEDENYATAPLFYLEPYDPSKKPMYCKEQVYAGGLEFQFEELRAILYRRKKEEEIKKKLETPKPVEKEKIEPVPLVKPESQIKSKSEKKKNKSEDSEKKATDSKRKTLFGKPKPIENPVLPEEPGPIDYSMNQTIHTKEALSEMQQLWFSKPASPLLNVNPPEKQIGKSILKPTKPSFNLYVDESCLDDFKKPVSKPIDDENKENDIPDGYCGPTGKSERKTTGILTPAENIETAPVPLSDEEEEDDDRDDIDGDFSAIIQCNTTGITETINFTKAFQNPRNESTPNPQKCFHNKPDMNDSVFVPEPCNEKRPQFKKPSDVEPSRLSCLSENSYQTNENPPKSFKHLSIIAETSREYKSSSSGSSAMIEGSLLLNRDPFSEEVIERFLKVVEFPNRNHVSGYYATGDKIAQPKVGGNLVLGDDSYDVKKMLGEGSYAKIFKIVNEKNGTQMIAKYQKPAFPWEFYITREVQARIRNKDLLPLFMNVESAYFFQNASILLTKPVEYGDLLSAINKMKQGQIMCQLLAMYFTVEILTILETLHSIKIIHGDIKPDNFLLMSNNNRPKLQLIDFGRGIDMSLFPENTTFNRVVTTEGFTTIEMQTGKPWTYQIDLYGAANCGHCLLFGEYMKVAQTGKVWNISKIIPRYWARTEWKNFFVTLLNIESCFNLPDISKLKSSFNAILSDDPELDFSITKLVNILKNR